MDNEIISIAPSWETQMKYCILTLETVTAVEVREYAKKEILRLARAMDKAQAEEKEEV